MELNYFDITISVIILLLGLKGIINGFFKELFGLVGIVGGIFVASRIGNEVGQYASEIVFKFENNAAINFAGFMITLAVFWLFMIFIGYIFKKLSSLSGLGAMDRLFGFLFGASKFFFIAAIIAHAAYNVKAIKASIDSNTTMKTSTLFPILIETGAYIMKLDPIEMSEDINNTIKTVNSDISDKVKTSTQEIVETAKREISSKMQEVE